MLRRCCCSLRFVWTNDRPDLAPLLRTLTRSNRSMSSQSGEAGPKPPVAEGNAEEVAEPRVDVASNLEAVRARVAAAAKKSGMPQPRLVAVSKTKPLQLVLDAYEAGQRVFGENYVQELVEKSNDPRVPEDIEWHFIGRLQSNKSNTLARVKNLKVVETVASEKLARTLNRAFAEHDAPLRVFMQVNTSGEENKGGVEPSDCAALAAFIANECDHLQLAGLMTIGMLNRSLKTDDTNEDFETLVSCRGRVAEAIGVDADALELSMGMSSDFEHAIEMGSTNVRVGSTIFGARHYPPKST
ncbi:alanine racemase [Salpingoeca rosetta]|uniref:Pyridoxal phosphate homeostasis protein n=1 Tax=Salpingoeca rosetta (strain ATCC 50818 / BSB-021) TaxID=946362 RepID=F2U472_SALR5|nr:alanine racemase [Salpingoeca rosetta]EGD82438.1 alanine racemase [Salpingoeca rosetta]|eukprot:XP_004995674.1 alanine racemase [Salpingoeca rosetta]